MFTRIIAIFTRSSRGACQHRIRTEVANSGCVNGCAIMRCLMCPDVRMVHFRTYGCTPTGAR